MPVVAVLAGLQTPRTERMHMHMILARSKDRLMGPVAARHLESHSDVTRVYGSGHARYELAVQMPWPNWKAVPVDIALEQSLSAAERRRIVGEVMSCCLAQSGLAETKWKTSALA